MPRKRSKPITLELTDRDYRRLRRRLEDLEDAETRAERRDAAAALERLADELELDDATMDALESGSVGFADDDEDSRADDDRRQRGRSRSSDDDGGHRRSRGQSSGGRRDDDDDDGDGGRVLVRRAADDDDDDDDGDAGGGKVRSLRQLRDDPDGRPPKRRADRTPARTPETTHWFNRPLGRRDDAGDGKRAAS
jgi:hypothetical protein